ncbi:carbohydrate ABC transporter permease [Kineococcus rhizosphaerae]|uniref:Carbohydrate ABC transporter membrane protein 2 (CUT1 family) n=1 Tax=Kineococcus rhizosphaerae TaxID=559628 RepID=A0A2T0R2J8_9ACTN|nr:carbohydrate ABC transporter permease [Kineococcus rhizosphaerae]PRY14029.1 carbohydrate ABC transporter membrane protein 2 (CUT1 family) [Kineococcus rhizosphaerae]
MSVEQRTTSGSGRIPAPRSSGRELREPKRRVDVLGYAGLVVAALVMVVPMLWMLLASLKQRNEIYTIPARWLPHALQWQNYADVFATVPFAHFLLNSVITTVLGAGFKVVLGLTCAYALVFVEFPGKRIVFLVVLAALMVPPQVTLIPNYTLIAQTGWLNTYQGIVVPGLASSLGTFLFRQHFQTLPVSVLEAATLDGAGHWRRLWQFVVPLSAPTVSAVALVSVVGEWNQYLWPLLVTDRSTMMTLPVGLTLLQNNDGITNWGVLMAGTVLVMLPILLVFLFFQRRLVAGLAAGALAN